VTDAPRVLAEALAAAREAQKRVLGALGVHVEGPFIDRRRKGVHPAEFIRPMLQSDADALIGARAGAMVVTLAPASVTLERIARLAGAGIVVSLGHSDASAEEAESVFRAGARAVTHLYNAMSQLSSRAPGVVGAALADSIFAGLHMSDDRSRRWPSRPRTRWRTCAWGSFRCSPIARRKAFPNLSARSQLTGISPPLTRISDWPRILLAVAKRLYVTSRMRYG